MSIISTEIGFNQAGEKFFESLQSIIGTVLKFQQHRPVVVSLCPPVAHLVGMIQHGMSNTSAGMYLKCPICHPENAPGCIRLVPHVIRNVFEMSSMSSGMWSTCPSFFRVVSDVSNIAFGKTIWNIRHFSRYVHDSSTFQTAYGTPNF